VEAAWPEPVQRVSSFLREAGAEARIEEFGEGTPTATAAAEAVGCELAQIVKSLVLVCDRDTVVALVPGDRRVDPQKVASAIRAAGARVASPEEVVRATGFAPGAVAPFPLPHVKDVLLDRTLLRHPLVWAGAGSTSHIVGLTPSELARLARARTVDVIQDHPYDFPTGSPGPLPEDSADPPEPKER
jgi:prolyl-tRNA editing enzyme YbaK/EbsC (Cys-tRNA(Pro) deacylase)